MLFKILQKLAIEVRRNEIAKSARQTLKEYRLGKIQPQTANEVLETLN